MAKPAEEKKEEETKEETPSWGKTLLNQLTSLGERITALEQTKETEKPVVEIPIPPKPKEKEEQKPNDNNPNPPQTQEPKRKGFLELLW